MAKILASAHGQPPIKLSIYQNKNNYLLTFIHFMLHYYGDITAMDLANLARHQIWMYARPDEEVCKVPFIDLQKNKRRYVKFERLAGVRDWVFTELVD